MKFMDFISKQAIIPDLKATDKKLVINELLNQLVKTEKIEKKDAKNIVNAINKREKQGSTGIGNGLAIPHVKQCKFVTKLVGVFARSVQGIDFDAIDGEPTYLFFLLLAPVDDEVHHLEALKLITTCARTVNFCRFLKNAKDATGIVGILKEFSQR